MKARTIASARIMACSLALLLLIASDDKRAVFAESQSNSLPLDSQAWSIIYSPGMPPHPIPQASGGWYFDFPNAPGSVNYVLSEVNMTASSSVDASIMVTTIGTTTFRYDFGPNNPCVSPAHV